MAFSLPKKRQKTNQAAVPESPSPKSLARHPRRARLFFHNLPVPHV